MSITVVKSGAKKLLAQSSYCINYSHFIAVNLLVTEFPFAHTDTHSHAHLKLTCKTSINHEGGQTTDILTTTSLISYLSYYIAVLRHLVPLPANSTVEREEESS